VTNQLSGVTCGCIMFIFSLLLLWWNESNNAKT